MTDQLPLDSEARAALKVASEHGGKLIRSQRTLGLYGPTDWERGRDDLKYLFGEGPIKTLVRRGLMAWDPDDARTAVIVEGAPQ